MEPGSIRCNGGAMGGDVGRPPIYRFATPAPHRVARWHFEPGDHHEVVPDESIYVHGWGVEFWVRPSYVGYPEQPTRHGLALFVDGGLRGLFTEGSANAPLELDRWHAKWVDLRWWETRSTSRARGSVGSTPPKPSGH